MKNRIWRGGLRGVGESGWRKKACVGVDSLGV
jgi:hypothetical protein